MIPAEKQILRTRLKADLAALAEKPVASAALRRRLQEFDLWRKARVIYGFAPLASEPDWLGEQWPQDKILAFPRIEGTTMTFWPALALSARGPMGVREPQGGFPAPPPDLILVPGLGFDRSGHRLGRGGGFYDRWLAQVPQTVHRLGLCFQCQLVEKIPSEQHDCLVSAVMTEEEIIIPGRTSR